LTRRYAVAIKTIAASLLLAVVAWRLLSPLFDEAPGGASASTAAIDTCSIAGRVLDEKGSGIVNATVCANPLSVATQIARCAQSTTDGAYALDRLAPRDYRVSASAPPFLMGASRDAVSLKSCAAQTGVDITLSDGGAQLRGRVFDNAEAVIQDASVRVVGEGLNADFGNASRSDAHGEFAMTVPAGAVHIEVSAKGFATTKLVAVAPIESLKIVLIPGSQLTGRVITKADGRGVPNLTLRAVPQGLVTSEFAPFTESGNSGTFSIEGLPPGVYRLEAVDAHWRGAAKQTIDVGLGAHIDDLIVEVTHGAQVRAKVAERESLVPCKRGHAVLKQSDSEQEDALDEQLVRAFRERSAPGDLQRLMRMRADRAPKLVLTSVIDAAGTVTFDGVPEGRYRADVRCYDYRMSGPAPILEVAERDVELEWSVERAARVVIVAKDEKGQPVTDADVGLLTEGDAYMAALHEGKGRYFVASVESGRYRAVCTSRPTTSTHQTGSSTTADEIPVVVDERGGDVEVELVIRGKGEILIDARRPSGEAVGGLHVAALPTHARTPNDVLAGSELGNGHYRIAPLIRGDYRIVIEDGRNPPIIREVMLADGESRSIEVQFASTGRIDGRVVDDNGRPAPGAVVSVTLETEAPMASPRRRRTFDRLSDGMALSDANGRFSLTGLADNVRFKVTAERAHGIAVNQIGVLPGDHPTLVLSSPRKLGGVVVDESGKPVHQFHISIYDKALGIGRSGVTVGGSGSWQIDGVMPGAQIISVADGSGREVEHELVVATGVDRLDLRIVLSSTRREAPE